MEEHDHHDCGCHHKHEACEGLSETETQVLQAIEERGYLPVARFCTTSEDGDVVVSALEPVYIVSLQDDMHTVKEHGAILSRLRKKGFITIDYDIPLSGYPYDEYKNSDIYAYFLKTVEAAAENSGFICKKPMLEMGSIALRDM